MSMLLTVLFTVFSIVCLLVYRIYFESKIGRRWLAISIESFLICIIIPICVNLLTPFFNEEERRKNELFRNTVIDAIVNKSMDRSDLEELILRQRKEIFQSADEEARRFVRDLIGQESSKRAELATLKARTDNLSDKLHLKWKPLISFVLRSFDERIFELQKQKDGIEIETRVEEFPLTVDLDSSHYTETGIRKVKFPNGFAVSISYGPSQIQQGLFLQPLVIDVYEVSQSPSRKTWVFSIRCYDNRVSLETTNPRYKNIVYQSSEDPLKDEQFKHKVNVAFNELITNTYLQ